MPGLEDPDNWRIQLNGSPFRFTDCSGSFEAENANITLTGIIKSSSLVTFAVGTFPPTIEVGNVAYPQSANLPGLPAMVAKKVAFKKFMDGLPIDPFGFDPSAPAGTYGQDLEVNIEYSASPIQTPRADDPATFLEISGNSTGGFIHSPAPRAKWLRKERNPADAPDTAEPGVDGPLGPQGEGIEEGSDPLGDRAAELFSSSSVSGSTSRDSRPNNADPTTSVTIVAPQTEWTLKWKQIPYLFWKNKLVWRLRWLLGRVNDRPFPLLFGALPETLLFVGFSYNQNYTWRDGLIHAPPIDLELKIIEKHVIWDGVVRGHNDYWRPGVGWETLLVDGTRKTYESRDFSVMFRI